MPQTLAEYPRLLLARKSELAYVYKRGLRTLRWTYQQLAGLAFRFARELEARDIGKGDRVMLWGENSAEWVAAFFGCMLRGAVAGGNDEAVDAVRDGFAAAGNIRRDDRQARRHGFEH